MLFINAHGMDYQISVAGKTPSPITDGAGGVFDIEPGEQITIMRLGDTVKPRQTDRFKGKEILEV